MIISFWNWLMRLPTEFKYFFDFVLKPLPYINIPPLYIVGFIGLSAILGFIVIRLVIGG